MQKNKHIFKKILMCLVAVIMCLSPILLAGCKPVGSNSSSGGNISSGGSSSGGTSSGGTSSGGSSGSSSSGGSSSSSSSSNPFDIEGAEFLSNYKISYRPSSDDDTGAFIADIKVQINEIAFDIIRSLYAQYGLRYDTTAFSGLNVTYVTINSSGEYTISTGKVANDSILKNAKPLFSDDSNMGIINTSTGNYDYRYKLNEHYSKYFNHENAIFADYDFDGNLHQWKWSGSLTLSNATVEQNLNAFVNNLTYRKKMEFALLLISAGYDITPTGNNYMAYKTGAEMIDTLRQTYTNDIEFYNAVDEHVFNTYFKLVDHSGYTDAEISFIANFIQNEVIGTDLVALDNTRYLNVTVTKGGTENQFQPLVSTMGSWYEKYNKFLTEESFASFYYDNDNDDVSNVRFYNTAPTDETEAEVNMINKLTNLSHQLFINQAQKYSNTNGNSITNSVEIIDTTTWENLQKLQVIQLYNNFIDVNNDGSFTADFWDIDGDGSTTNVLSEKAGNQTVFIFSVRKQYFKNYGNTTFEVVKQIVRAPENNTNTIKYAQQTFDYDLKYPIIPASFFADYTNDDVLLNGDGLMHMPTGYKRYQNVVIMPKETFYLEEFYMFLTRQTDTSAFEVTIYARYYDAESNTYATWDQGETESQFYNCGTVTVVEASNLSEISDPLGINSSQILSSAKINGTEKGDCMLHAFSDLPAGNAYNPTLITKNHDSAKMFNFVDLPNGQKTITYSSRYLTQDKRTSYIELLFATDNNNNFQFAIMPTEAYA